MDFDETTKKPRQDIVVGEDLTTLSQSELERRITALKDEIDRVQAELDAKKQRQAAADSLFK